MAGLFNRLAVGTALAALFTAFAPTTAHADVERMPLVAAPAHSNTAAPLDTVKDGGGGGDKVWFAYKFPDNLKANLEKAKWPLFAVSFIFFGLGAGVWAPIVFNGASFDMEWALPVLVWFGISWIGWAIFWFVGWWTYFTYLICIPIIIAAHYFGTQVMFANLNRGSTQLDSNKGMLTK